MVPSQTFDQLTLLAQCTSSKEFTPSSISYGNYRSNSYFSLPLHVMKERLSDIDPFFGPKGHPITVPSESIIIEVYAIALSLKRLFPYTLRYTDVLRITSMLLASQAMESNFSTNILGEGDSKPFGRYQLLTKIASSIKDKYDLRHYDDNDTPLTVRYMTIYMHDLIVQLKRFYDPYSALPKAGMTKFQFMRPFINFVYRQPDVARDNKIPVMSGAIMQAMMIYAYVNGNAKLGSFTNEASSAAVHQLKVIIRRLILSNFYVPQGACKPAQLTKGDMYLDQYVSKEPNYAASYPVINNVFTRDAALIFSDMACRGLKVESPEKISDTDKVYVNAMDRTLFMKGHPYDNKVSKSYSSYQTAADIEVVPGKSFSSPDSIPREPSSKSENLNFYIEL